MGFFVDLMHSFQVWQGIREEVFVRRAFVKVYALTLASVFAQAIVVALLALVLNAKTFLNKLDCLWMTLKLCKVGVKDVAKRVLVRAVEVAGINLAVRFNDVLMGAMAVHATLLGTL